MNYKDNSSFSIWVLKIFASNDSRTSYEMSHRKKEGTRRIVLGSLIARKLSFAFIQ
ncbi:hypothetical protein CEXT_701951, partial [Caerostris extrusa]